MGRLSIKAPKIASYVSIIISINMDPVNNGAAVEQGNKGRVKASIGQYTAQSVGCLSIISSKAPSDQDAVSHLNGYVIHVISQDACARVKCWIQQAIIMYTYDAITRNTIVGIEAPAYVVAAKP